MKITGNNGRLYDPALFKKAVEDYIRAERGRRKIEERKTKIKDFLEDETTGFGEQATQSKPSDS
jgi:hypothetical protein